jgi:hypothetical protein
MKEAGYEKEEMTMKYFVWLGNGDLEGTYTSKKKAIEAARAYEKSYVVNDDVGEVVYERPTGWYRQRRR